MTIKRVYHNSLPFNTQFSILNPPTLGKETRPKTKKESDEEEMMNKSLQQFERSRDRVSNPGTNKSRLFSKNVQPGYEAPWVCYWSGTSEIFFRNKTVWGSKLNTHLLCSDEMKNARRNTSIPPPIQVCMRTWINLETRLKPKEARTHIPKTDKLVFFQAVLFPHTTEHTFRTQETKNVYILCCLVTL